MKSITEIVQKAFVDALLFLFKVHTSDHIVMVSNNEFHYLEPNGDEFKCFTGVELLKRDNLPDSVNPMHWTFHIYDNIDAVLDMYNNLFKHKDMLAIIPDAEIVD